MKSQASTPWVITQEEMNEVRLEVLETSQDCQRLNLVSCTLASLLDEGPGINVSNKAQSVEKPRLLAKNCYSLAKSLQGKYKRISRWPKSYINRLNKVVTGDNCQKTLMQEEKCLKYKSGCTIVLLYDWNATFLHWKKICHHRHMLFPIVYYFCLFHTYWDFRIKFCFVKKRFGFYFDQSERRNEFLTREKIVSSNHKPRLKRIVFSRAFSRSSRVA